MGKPIRTTGKSVKCLLCGRWNPDEGPFPPGRGGTCWFCGMSPLPSFTFPVGSVFRAAASYQGVGQRIRAIRKAAAQRHGTPRSD